MGQPGASKPYGVAPYLRLSGYADIDSYLASRKARVRGSIRRRLRNIAADGDVEFHVHAPDDVAGVLAWLPRLEAAREGRYGIKSLPTGSCSRWCEMGAGAAWYIAPPSR